MKLTRKLAVVTIAGLFAVTVAENAKAQNKATPSQTAPARQEPQVKEDFTDDRLKKFIEVNKKLQPHQQEAENQMVKAIEQEGLSPDRFNQILGAQQQSDTSNAGATSTELTKFNNAAKKIMTIQNSVIPKLEKVMTDEGMKPEEFQQIVVAYNRSPKVQQKINSLLQQEPKK